LDTPDTPQTLLTRRRLLAGAAAGGASLGLVEYLAQQQRSAAASSRDALNSRGSDALRPTDAVGAILAALTRWPLVAVTERHLLQEWHDTMNVVLWHPDLFRGLTDIVVEFGVASYQPMVDRFVVEGAPLAKPELVQVWRQVGDPEWNAPVYEQLFRTVRAINRRRPASQRIRILLGQQPITMSDVLRRPQDGALRQAFLRPMDDHFAALVKREVLDRNRRALLIAGKGHLLRGIRQDPPGTGPNAGSQLAALGAGKLHVIDNLILPPGTPPDASARRVHNELSRPTTPVVASLAGTWLGATSRLLGNGWINELADRASSPAAARYGHQADAVLYLGPGETLTISNPDPTLYETGRYAHDLQQATNLPGFGDVIGDARREANAGPSWFSLLGYTPPTPKEKHAVNQK
jgi:hypothetical protein